LGLTSVSQTKRVIVLILTKISWDLRDIGKKENKWALFLSNQRFKGRQKGLKVIMEELRGRRNQK